MILMAAVRCIRPPTTRVTPFWGESKSLPTPSFRLGWVVAKGIHDARYQAVIETLRNTRVARKLSQAAVADRLGRRQQFVSKYESGERRLDVIEFVDVATVLGIDWKTLLLSVNIRD